VVTRRIAESLGIHHPSDTATKTPLVMTTDFLWIYRATAKRAKKPVMSSQLQS